MIKRIGILTSGGDSPGMNAAIRAVVRAGITAGLEVFGIKDGYLGMHQNRIIRLDRQSVTDIINRGGTILGTARFTAFKEESVRKEAVQNLKDHNIDAMIIIGGDGSYMGALRLSEMGIPCIGIPGTIDNDIHGTDFTIGYDTALNTIVECMDKLRDTCNSHKRVSIVEIMGRHCGDLATNASIAAGADCQHDDGYKNGVQIETIQNKHNIFGFYGAKLRKMDYSHYICRIKKLLKNKRYTL